MNKIRILDGKYGCRHYYAINEGSLDCLHREDGPAIEYANGDKQWYLNGKRHREDGPAIEYVNGCKQWYYHGKWINCKDHQEFLRMIKLMVFL